MIYTISISGYIYKYILDLNSNNKCCFREQEANHFKKNSSEIKTSSTIPQNPLHTIAHWCPMASVFSAFFLETSDALVWKPKNIHINIVFLQKNQIEDNVRYDSESSQ